MNTQQNLQDALEDSSLRCVALQGQLFALAQSYKTGEAMADELFEAILWGIGADIEQIKSVIDRVPYQHDASTPKVASTLLEAA